MPTCNIVFDSQGYDSGADVYKYLIEIPEGAIQGQAFVFDRSSGIGPVDINARFQGIPHEITDRVDSVLQELFFSSNRKGRISRMI